MVNIMENKETLKEKLFDRITNDKNLNYGIYGSDGSKWFLKDKNLKAPLNYFQQQVLHNYH